MIKNTNRFRDLYHEYNDCLEHIATQGLDSLSDSEQIYAQKLADASQEFIETLEEEKAGMVEDEELEDE